MTVLANCDQFLHRQPSTGQRPRLFGRKGCGGRQTSFPRMLTLETIQLRSSMANRKSQSVIRSKTSCHLERTARKLESRNNCHGFSRNRFACGLAAAQINQRRDHEC